MIAELLGFSGIDFTFGPYFKPSDATSQGAQIDLLFDRADNVITLCEMKFTVGTVGAEVIAEVERKSNVIRAIATRKTIQRVLIVHGNVSRELVASGYFFRIIRSEELLSASLLGPESSRCRVGR